MTTSENPCQAFFEQYAQESNKAELLQKSGEALQWEYLSASRHSPGPVSSDESVLRLVINPIHVDPEDGNVKPTLMSDVKDKGGSVQRLTHISREHAISSGQAVVETKNASIPGGSVRSIYGTVKLSVHEIRSLAVATQARAFGVFDTAKEANTSHADIFQLAGSGQAARSARMQLFELATRGFQAT